MEREENEMPVVQEGLGGQSAAQPRNGARSLQATKRGAGRSARTTQRIHFKAGLSGQLEVEAETVDQGDGHELGPVRWEAGTVWRLLPSWIATVLRNLKM